MPDTGWPKRWQVPHNSGLSKNFDFSVGWGALVLASSCRPYKVCVWPTRGNRKAPKLNFFTSTSEPEIVWQNSHDTPSSSRAGFDWPSNSLAGTLRVTVASGAWHETQ